MIDKILKFGAICALIFVFFGCAKYTPKNSQSLMVTMISPMIKINDAGFLHIYKDKLNLQIYSLGANVANIKIGDKICINHVCYDELVFNKKFLLNEHYSGLLSDILQGRKIYDGLNAKLNECGFDQNISNKWISYEVCGLLVKFNDRKNRIKIIIKELK